METLNLEDVFKRSGLPTYTFVEPREYAHLKVALRTPGRGVIIEGPSGIGKTTAVLTAVSQMGWNDRLQKLSARIPEDVEIIHMLPDLVRSKDGAGLVVIDDFHRLPDVAKHQIADLMKDMADREDEKSKIVLIGINRAGNSLVSFGRVRQRGVISGVAPGRIGQAALGVSCSGGTSSICGVARAAMPSICM